MHRNTPCPLFTWFRGYTQKHILKIKALNNVHSFIVLFIEITGAWPRPPAQKAVVMETAQDANLTTTDIQTRRNTLSPALPTKSVHFSRGQICSTPSLPGPGHTLLWGRGAVGSNPTCHILHPKTALGKQHLTLHPNQVSLEEYPLLSKLSKMW